MRWTQGNPLRAVRRSSIAASRTIPRRTPVDFDGNCLAPDYWYAAYTAPIQILGRRENRRSEVARESYVNSLDCRLSRIETLAVITRLAFPLIDILNVPGVQWLLDLPLDGTPADASDGCDARLARRSEPASKTAAAISVTFASHCRRSGGDAVT